MNKGSLLAAVLACGLVGTGCSSMHSCGCGKDEDHDKKEWKHHEGGEAKDGKDEKGEMDEKKDAKDDETPVKMADLPAPVKDTLTKEAGAGKVGDIAKEQWKGKTIYEADVTIDSKEYELKIAEDGQMLDKKLEIDDEKDEKKEDEKK